MESLNSSALVITSIVTAGYLVKRFAIREDIGPDAAPEVEPASCQRSPSKTLETIEETRPVSEAELLCRMYRALGTSMLTKLKGEFSFLVFNAKTVKGSIIEPHTDSHTTCILYTYYLQDLTHGGNHNCRLTQLSIFV